MAEAMLTFCESPNGDSWSLGKRDGCGALQVLHCANASSGGARTWLRLVEFMATNPGSPEHSALVERIDAIVSDRIADRRCGLAELLMHFRDATEAEAMAALSGSKVRLPLGSTSDALEFFNCMVDLLTGLRQVEDEADARRIPAGFGSTH
ncbi:hypothetical protein [Novosphingobium sp. BW1]|uniref:hypothetical protein n=1 Tax=Novosphingobium sp. BW1 TaxID=2592621 RepID=UPI0011DE8E98|nr:hypothetical protein [Novosphingobium sp. BW1]TYC86534.1 hypothetical protein FMM79_14395 [Novosphingobium sp. BW1]